jgi:demethylmenaquinone methyltransferase/2-methoxy-6-polyprenyl-1,4-benzoquinol methylase
VNKKMAFSKSELVSLYRRRASKYDFSANLYYLIGMRINAYRKKTITSLNLSQGDTVLELACGTGLNFNLLQNAVGPTGKIVGLDITDTMLDKAQSKVEANNWNNVELVNADATDYCFPRELNAIFSTFAITLIPEYDDVIKYGSNALTQTGRFAVLDFKEPTNMPSWLTRMLTVFTKPFGVTIDLADRHPWESIERHLNKADFQEFYFGYCYLSVGEKTGKP